MLNFDLHCQKAQQNARDVLTAFCDKGAHINGAGEIVIPSPSPNDERTRLCRKFGFRFSSGVYPQWHRSPGWYGGRQWSSEQWLVLAQKIEDAAG